MVRAVISDFGGVLTTPLIESFLAYQEESRAVARGPRPRDGARPRTPTAAGTPSSSSRRATSRRPSSSSRLEAHLGGGRLARHARHLLREPAPEPADDRLGARRRASAGMRTALLTNNVREWEPLWRAKLPEIDELFEVVVDSAFVGMRKPEPRDLRAHAGAARRRASARGLPVHRRHRGELRRGPRARHARRAFRVERAGDCRAGQNAQPGLSRARSEWAIAERHARPTGPGERAGSPRPASWLRSRRRRAGRRARRTGTCLELMREHPLDLGRLRGPEARDARARSRRRTARSASPRGGRA